VKTIVAALGVAAATAGLAAGLAWRRHARAIDRLQERLRRPAAAADAADPGPLPPPVARYLQFALGQATVAPSLVEMRQVGELRTDERAGRWMPFTAVQRVSPAACGFVWNAKVDVAPLVHLRVVDALLDGQGAGQVLLQSILEVASDAGSAPMNAGSLHRFLAEAVWYPWVLVPSKALRWDPIDDTRARATLTCGATSVCLEFGFASNGEVASIFTSGRWGRFEGRYEQVPWEGRFSGYASHAGVRVPTAAAVGWHRDGEPCWVWRGTLTGYQTQ
jgi:hypothetical protein